MRDNSCSTKHATNDVAPKSYSSFAKGSSAAPADLPLRIPQASHPNPLFREESKKSITSEPPVPRII